MMAGGGTVEVWFRPQRYPYVGTIATAVFVAAVAGFLGDVCFELERSREHAMTAMVKLGTMREITQTVEVVKYGLNGLRRRVAQTIGEHHRYECVAIYLSEPKARDLRLSGWARELRGLGASLTRV